MASSGSGSVPPTQQQQQLHDSGGARGTVPGRTTTVADVVVRTLADSGVSVCFANPGTTEMFVVAALDQQERVRPILCLHEAVASGAADGFARLTRSPALCLLHLGPGLSNALSNLHNAHRARSPVLVLVGEHATWHRAADPPLAQDIQALAASVSRRVLTINIPQQVQDAVLEAVALTGDGSSSSSSAGSSRGAGPLLPHSRVATLVLPHDISWQQAPAPEAAARPAARQTTAAPLQAAEAHDRRVSLTQQPAGRRFLEDCAAALHAAPRGKAALLLGGAALLNEGDALVNAGRVAAALGARLLCEALPGRITRGAGLPHCTRLSYWPQEAAAQLAAFDVLLLLDVRRPVAQFGYKDGPSQLLRQEEANIWELDDSTVVAEALACLAQELVPGACVVRPGLNCGGVFALPHVPALPTGRLTVSALCQAVAALQPAGTIVVDESLTSGGPFWEASKGCAAFDCLCLTGGAIGSGPPMATGAAVACHHSQQQRRVINLQADGSCMYTLQALWTQAHEGLRVLTVLCDNASYAILRVEAMRQRTSSASRCLTMLAQPDIDWVSLARGMGVPGGRAEDCEQLTALLREGLAAEGPFLVHAVLR